MLWQLAQWSESTALGDAIRNSQYLFPMIEFVHLVALAIIGGAVLIVDMRLLGLGLRNTPVEQITREAQPYLTGSLIVMLVTGLALYSSEATKCYASWAFWVKIGALILAMIFTYTIKKRVTTAENLASSFAGKAVAATSLTLWFAVAWGGRWIGFGG